MIRENVFRFWALTACLFAFLAVRAADVQYGTIGVTSTPSGAEVFIDGEQKGVTPVFLDNMVTGAHKVVVRKPGYELYSGTVLVSSGQLMQVKAKLVEEQQEEVADGKKKRKKVEGIERSRYFNETRYYAGASYNFGNYKATEAALGMVHRRLNLEVDYTMANSDEINCGGNFLPTRNAKDIWKHYHELKNAITGRVGLVVGQSERVCLVTQLGYSIITMNGFKCKYNEDVQKSNFRDSKMTAGGVGFRLDWMVLPHVAVSGTSELDFLLGKDDYIADIVDKASVTMKDWATGLKFKVGVAFYL